MPANTNGTSTAAPRSLISFDPDDPDYIKDLQRPAAIKEDLSEMERRKRVQEILESKSFCTQLEALIRQESCNTKTDPEHLSTLQRLSELTLPQGTVSTLRSIGCSSGVPIADMKSAECSKNERLLRNKLASLYRLVDLFQWAQGIYNHITLSLAPAGDELLINPFGLLYHEVTAASLIKISLNGDVLDAGSTKLGINQAGYVLHSAIHAARPDVRCVLHLHTAVVSAVSSMKCGLLPICQEAMLIGPVAYHDYQGILDAEVERESIVHDLGDKNVMLLRNHGFVVCAASVEYAFHLAFNTILAAETQLRAVRAGLDNLVIPDEDAVQRAYTTAKQGGGGVNRSPADGRHIDWRIGELEWEAWMRVLDNAGYRTGHVYRQALPCATAMPVSSNHNDIAIPPSASAMGEVDETDAEAFATHKRTLLRKEQERSRWLNSPNAYQRIQVLETGTDHPKKITKWVQDMTSASNSGTAVKISSPHQFSPFTNNPKEFKDKQKAIKETRRLGATSAGPQSQILDGVTYEDIAQMRSEGEAVQEGVLLIGTASKGIIDRQHQHNAQVYRQLYAPNPFASETDEDIQKYMREVESKTPRPGSDLTSPPSPIYETDSPSAETVSLMQAARQHRSRPLDDELPTDMSTVARHTLDVSAMQRGSPLAESTPNRVACLSLDVASSRKPVPGVSFTRSKSERCTASTRSNVMASNAHTPPTSCDVTQQELNCKEGKKKKKGFFSFGKKKK